MAQLNITLNQEEILQLISEDRDSAFARLLQESLNAILKAESAEQLKAQPYERTEERTGSRNGFRDRPLTTRIGKLTLKVPKHRGGEPFKTYVFDNYCRSEAALIITMAEMVVNGVSTRKISNVMETLCGKSFSKSTVSEACGELDEKVREFRERPLTGEYPFLMVDATYFKARVNSRVISRAFMVAYATNIEGRREIIGFGVYNKEGREEWNDFLKGLKARGLKGVRMITSDAHDGIIYAICHQFPGVPWQRCQFHFSRNITQKTPAKYQKGLSGELQEMYNCRTIEEARKKKDSILADYGDVAESAMRCLDEGFEEAMTVMALPQYLRKYLRTSNPIERVNKELKRRSNVIGIFPNDDSIIRLMGAVLLEYNDEISKTRRIFREETYNRQMTAELKAELANIADEQRRLLAA